MLTMSIEPRAFIMFDQGLGSQLVPRREQPGLGDDEERFAARLQVARSHYVDPDPFSDAFVKMPVYLSEFGAWAATQWTDLPREFPGQPSSQHGLAVTDPARARMQKGVMADVFQYDVAPSFAGEDRTIAEALAQALVATGIRVFYDGYEQATLWGKDLYQHLQTVYRDTAHYCVLFISAAYARKLWTRHELQQAQARAFRERQEYILPLRLDDTELPGLNATVGYLDLRTMDIAAVVQLLLEKLSGTAPRPAPLDLRGYQLAKGHIPPMGILKRRLAVPALCGATTFPCVGEIKDTGQLRKQSQWFAIESESTRDSIARAARCEPDEIDEIWSVAIGPPLTHILVTLIDSQLLVLKVDLDGQSFAPVELVPPFPSPGRRDTRAVAIVDLLQDGGRQLLLASDGASGSGLGQTLVGVYRLQAQRLVRIFEEELDFNFALDFDDGVWENRWTTLHWGTELSSPRRPLVHANKTRTLGDLRATRSVEYEWDGKRFHQPNKAGDESAEDAEEIRFRAEADRLRRLARNSGGEG